MQNNISKERIMYLKKIRINKIAVILTQIFLIIFVIATWEFLANTGTIDSFITSSPSRIAKTFMNLLHDGLQIHLLTTCYETIIGFLFGTLLGIGIAILLWWSEFIFKVFEPFLVILNSLPKVALGPVIIIWAGARNNSNNYNGDSHFTHCNNFRNI